MWNSWPRGLIVPLLLAVPMPLAAAQDVSTTAGISQEKEPPKLSKTMEELQLSVESLSYQSEGRRILRLRDSTIIKTLKDKRSDKSSGHAKRPTKTTPQINSQPLEKSETLRQNIDSAQDSLSFELVCNPMGEVDAMLPVNTADNVQVKTKDLMADPNMKRIAELGCLEPEFAPTD